MIPLNTFTLLTTISELIYVKGDSMVQHYTGRFDKLCKSTRRKLEIYYNKVANDPIWRESQDRVYEAELS